MDQTTTDQQKLAQPWIEVQQALDRQLPGVTSMKLLDALRTARAALADEKAELALLMMSDTTEAVLTLDAMGVITGATAGSADILGRSVEDIVGKPVDVCLENRGEGPPVSASEMVQAELGQPVTSVRIQERADGSTFEAQHTVMAVVGRLGHLSGFIRQIEDISQRSAHELRIEELDATIALLLPSKQAAQPDDPRA